MSPNIIFKEPCPFAQKEITYLLLSNDIFGITKDDRTTIFAYINLGGESFLHPLAEKVGFRLHNILVWKKNNCTPNRWYMKNCEFIVFLHKGKSFPINNLGDSQLYECDNINGKNKLHPTQKPLEYTDRLILNSSKEGDLILDIFCGSGTTCLSSKLNNRNFIGFELDENYFNIAKDRIENNIE